MTGRGTFAVMAALALAAATVIAQRPAPQKTIKRVPIEPTSMASGSEMYSAYCAACHGKAGRGDGPAASAFKTPPTNLTTLSAKNGGKFPEMEVVSVLQWGLRHQRRTARRTCRCGATSSVRSAIRHRRDSGFTT